MAFLMLPDDLALNCLARVSRLYYPTLSLVSKKFRSLLASLELYQTRTLLGCTESCLYVCLRFPFHTNQTRWFTLCRKPMQIIDHKPNHIFRKKENKLSENCLVSVPTRTSPYVGWYGVITVGYNIYKVNPYLSSKVIFMDCRSHTWYEAPNMHIARRFPAVNVLDGKIYVVGGNKDCDSSNWMEFFDPKTQVWEHVQSPDDADICDNISFRSLAIEGKLYLFGNKSVVYNPKENRWEENELWEMGLISLHFYPFCVVNNVLYCYGWSRKLEWYDYEARSWSNLKGLEKLPKLPTYDCVRLVGYGGNIMVVWKDGNEIWCAEIWLERLNNRQEIHGKIEWCYVVLTVFEPCAIMQALVVTV